MIGPPSLVAVTVASAGTVTWKPTEQLETRHAGAARVRTPRETFAVTTGGPASGAKYVIVVTARAPCTAPAVTWICAP